jgi:putative nucleotidyltransferase with HDIG domain
MNGPTNAVPASGSETMERKRILFVDDEAQVLGGLQDLLRKQRRNWEMVFALGGDVALEELRKAPFDVVVSDMRMPGMDGAELLRRVQQEYPIVARIVLSGYAERDAMVRALPVAHQFLSKPCDAEELRVVIDRACGLQALLHDAATRKLVGKLDKLPSVPQCYLELTRAVTNPEGGLGVVANIVERDPAMSAKVLQLVNSGYFGLGQRVTSVQRAVIYLGIDLIQGLALTAEVFSTIAVPTVEGFSLDQVQEHSFLTARLAKRLVSDPKRAEEAFAAAIVHDIGKMILALVLPERYAEVIAVARSRNVPTFEVEAELLGVTHAEVGAYLLGAWGLPMSIVEAVAYHHAPRRLCATAKDVLAAVHVADALVTIAGTSDRTLTEAQLLDVAFLEEAQLAGSLPHWRELVAAELRGMAKTS